MTSGAPGVRACTEPVRAGMRETGRSIVSSCFTNVGRGAAATWPPLAAAARNWSMAMKYAKTMTPQITPDKHFAPDDLAAVVSKTGQASGKPIVAPLFPPGTTYTNPYWATVLGN